MNSSSPGGKGGKGKGVLRDFCTSSALEAQETVKP